MELITDEKIKSYAEYMEDSLSIAYDIRESIFSNYTLTNISFENNDHFLSPTFTYVWNELEEFPIKVVLGFDEASKTKIYQNDKIIFDAWDINDTEKIKAVKKLLGI